MAGKKKQEPGRVKLLIGVISKEDVSEFTDAVNELAVAVHFAGIAAGTAKSNYLSYLGLGEIERRLTMSMIPEYAEKQILKSINKRLKLYLPGQGIAFTVPMSAVSSIMSNAILSKLDRDEQTKNAEGKKMSKAANKHDLIVAVVNQKYTEKVLESTRLAGATGASLLHTRSISNERAEQIIGTTLKQETDTIFLLTASEYKVKIMEAIRDTAGLKTEGGAVIFSVPVDAITGIGRFDEESEDKDEAEEQDAEERPGRADQKNKSVSAEAETKKQTGETAPKAEAKVK